MLLTSLLVLRHLVLVQGILRGDVAKLVVIFAEETLLLKKDFGVSMFPVVQVDVLIEFLPFLALETGIGYGMSTVLYSMETPLGKITNGFKRDGIIIPLMARVQYDFRAFSIYASIGPKFVIPISEYEYAEINGKKQDLNYSDDFFSKFIMDLGFAIGAEYKLAKVHYMGLWVAYDWNLISPIKDNTTVIGRNFKINDFWHDVFGVSLTYRYAL